MLKLWIYAFNSVVMLYFVTCYWLYHNSEARWGHDFFAFKSFLTATFACRIFLAAFSTRLVQGDAATRHDEKVMLITIAVVLYASLVIFNCYKTGFAIGLFGSAIQASIFIPLAVYCPRLIVVYLSMIPCFAYLTGGAGRVQTVTETVYRTRNY